MERVCNRFSSILGEWRVITIYLRETAKGASILKLNRAHRMKRRCLLLLGKNAKKRKAERQENEFIQLFYYTRFIKSIFKALVLHRDSSIEKKQFMAEMRSKLDKSKQQRILRGLLAASSKLRLLRNLRQGFEAGNVKRRIVKEMFAGWKEAIENKKIVDVFVVYQLQKRAFNYLRHGIQTQAWLNQGTVRCDQFRKRSLKKALFNMVHHFSSRQRQLRVLFLTRLETSQTLMKKQIIYELRSYSEQKKHWSHIEFNATMQLRLSKKRSIYKELVNHNLYKQKLKSIAKQVDKKLKQRVLENMVAATQKQIRLNKTFTELKTSHYKSFCIDMF